MLKNNNISNPFIVSKSIPEEFFATEVKKLHF